GYKRTGRSVVGEPRIGMIMWNARILAAVLLTMGAVSAAAPKPVLGTVAELKAEALQLGIKPDEGDIVFVKMGPDTQVFRVPPGERDLQKAQPSKVTDIAFGDRVLVSFVDGMDEARRIVVISANEIARRNEAERQDWKKRGLSGVVISKGDGEFVLETPFVTGAKRSTIALNSKTVFRRYAPDSVKFAEAEP